MTPRPLPIKRVFPWAVVSTAIQSRSRRRWASLRADLTPRRATSLALVVGIVFITGCATPLPTRRDVVIGLVGEPRTVFDDDPSARFVASAVTGTLVRRDAHDELTPRLAESVPTLENGDLRVVTDDADAPDGRLVATFRLRDTKWQDGVSITATDVRFAWQQDRADTPGTLTRWMADRISDIQILSTREVRVLYRNGERWDDYALGPRVMPSHRLAQATPEQRVAYAREPVHAGAFAIAAWLPGSITLSAYQSYVLGTPKLGRLEIHFFPSRASALQALLRGEIGVAAGSQARTDVARRVAGDLAAIGIAADVRERAPADLAAEVQRGEFDLAITSEEAADPQLASERWFDLVDPWFDALARLATETPDRVEKRAIYTEMERIWTSALPALPLYQELRVDVAPQSLAGIEPTPSGSPLSWNVSAWSFLAR